jgi:WhiB family redox-sensing transcriptional regulator
VNLDGMRRAACKGQPDEVFFPDLGDDGERPNYTTARHICAGCPVQAQCLVSALELKICHGMFAGLTPAERATLRRQRPGKAA